MIEDLGYLFVREAVLTDLRAHGEVFNTFRKMIADERIAEFEEELISKPITDENLSDFEPEIVGRSYTLRPKWTKKRKRLDEAHAEIATLLNLIRSGEITGVGIEWWLQATLNHYLNPEADV